MCKLSIRKKSGNLFNDPCIYIYIERERGREREKERERKNVVTSFHEFSTSSKYFGSMLIKNTFRFRFPLFNGISTLVGYLMPKPFS